MGVRDASQCTFWCSVLSDTITYLFHPQPVGGLNAPFGAQCFPTRTRQPCRHKCRRLNAPFGAQCFPTGGCCRRQGRVQLVSMHLLVLSAFRPARNYAEDDDFVWSQCTFWCSVLSDDGALERDGGARGLFQCTFWCSVLSDKPLKSSKTTRLMSQCTFWCSVLSDLPTPLPCRRRRVVSMHLLVLSAFRH